MASEISQWWGMDIATVEDFDDPSIPSIYRDKQGREFDGDIIVDNFFNFFNDDGGDHDEEGAFEKYMQEHQDEVQDHIDQQFD